MTEPTPNSPTFLPFPSPDVAKESFEAFWDEVRAAMKRNNIPHLAAVAAAGAFPEFETVGQGKDHKHEIKVLTSVCCAGNDQKLQGFLAALLLRSVIDDEHEDLEKRYQELVCGIKHDESPKNTPAPTKKAGGRSKRR